MRAVTQFDLQTLDALKDLARANVDSSMSLEEAARSVEDNQLGNLFLIMAQRRRRNVESLCGYVQFDEAEYESRAALRGTLHRWWHQLRSAMQHEDPRAVVVQAERSEAAIQRVYEKILGRIAGSALYDVLHTQYREVLQNHERIREIMAHPARGNG